MDDFEKYIAENRAHFDDQVPDTTKIWDAIATQLDPPEKQPRSLWNTTWLKIAASIVIVISIGTVGGIISTKFQAETPIVHEELHDVDAYYQGLIAFQVKLVHQNTTLSDADKEEFLSFMDELDEEYKVLRAEMHQNLNNEHLLEAIVNNYKKRIELIENLLEQINQDKKSYENEGYTL